MMNKRIKAFIGTLLSMISGMFLSRSGDIFYIADYPIETNLYHAFFIFLIGSIFIQRSLNEKSEPSSNLSDNKDL
jgi:Na+/proline symporter